MKGNVENTGVAALQRRRGFVIYGVQTLNGRLSVDICDILRSDRFAYNFKREPDISINTLFMTRYRRCNFLQSVLSLLS